MLMQGEEQWRVKYFFFRSEKIFHMRHSNNHPCLCRLLLFMKCAVGLDRCGDGGGSLVRSKIYHASK